MSCCGTHNRSEHDEIHEEKKKTSWKTALVVLIVLGLLIFGSIGLMIH